MKRLLLASFVFTAACAHPQPAPAPEPPAALVYCIAPSVDDGHGHPVPGASVDVASRSALTNTDGYAYLQPIPAGDNPVSVTADGFNPRRFVYHADSWTCDLPVTLTRTLPPLPTRDDILNVKMTFQGLMVPTQQFGQLPWFEAALPWLNAADRFAVYTAKHASTAWPGGDTHALIFLPSGPPLYDEPNQPYSADRFGPLDWTNGNTKIDPKLADLVLEVANAGFNRQLLFLGGDDGERGFPIAMRQLDLVHDALLNSAYGDLRGYVVPFPGFDGVFYGYTPEHIWQWGAKCQTLFPYCGIEHSTGHIPTGEGDSDWVGTGGMRAYDLLLSEFDDNRFDDSVWQIMARLIGPAYRRPPEQPASDDPGAPFGPNAGQFYLRQPTDRGAIVNCAFEFREYSFVRDRDVEAVNRARDYFKARGATCGGE